jgi:hypothetical protein
VQQDLTEEGNAILRTETIRQTLSNFPRCNYIVLDATEYRQLDNGSWQLKDNGEMINRPDILSFPVKSSLPSTAVNVCFPLSIAFINCLHPIPIDVSDCELQSDHSVYLMTNDYAVNMGDYFKSPNSYTICNKPKMVGLDRILNFFYAGCHALSAICFLITIIYQLHGSGKMNCHTKSLLCHIVSLFLAYLCETADSVIIVLPTYPPTWCCYVLYIFLYISYMWAFFWLNVLAFDVLYAFSQMQTSKYSCAATWTETRRFLFYNIYAWFAPMILCAIMVTVDQSPSIQKALSFNPKLGLSCYSTERTTKWVFYYIPLCFIMTTNLLSFFGTVIILMSASKGTQLVNRAQNMVM